MAHPQPEPPLAAPRAGLPVRQLLGPLRRFLRVQSAGGIVLLACAAVALAAANSRFAADYDAFWHTPISLAAGGTGFGRPLEFWVNDVLMVVFFFVVGLE